MGVVCCCGEVDGVVFVGGVFRNEMGFVIFECG